jgi:hypothetical protein
MRLTRKMLALPIAAATLLVSAGGASAAPPKVEVIVEKDLSGLVLTNDCNGEDVTFTDGFFRTVILTYPDGTAKQRVATQLKGVGASGTKYITNQTLQDNFDGTAYKGGSEAVLISQGPQPNVIMTFRWDGNNYSADFACHG